MAKKYFTSPAIDKTTKDKLNKMHAELQALRQAIADVARQTGDKTLLEIAVRSLDRANAARILKQKRATE